MMLTHQITQDSMALFFCCLNVFQSEYSVWGPTNHIQTGKNFDYKKRPWNLVLFDHCDKISQVPKHPNISWFLYSLRVTSLEYLMLLFPQNGSGHRIRLARHSPEKRQWWRWWSWHSMNWRWQCGNTQFPSLSGGSVQILAHQPPGLCQNTWKYFLSKT